MNPTDTGIEYWSRHLARVQLPVLSSAAHLEQMLDLNISVQQLARLLRNDLSLALDALLMAARLPQVGGEPQSLAHAVSVFGVERVQNLVRARMERSYEPSQIGHQAFAQALAVNRFAALLVERWDGTRQPGGAESLFWMTLACGAVRFRLPLLAPVLAKDIERRVRAGEDRTRLESELLGCRSDDLSLALVREMGLKLDPALLDSLHVTGLRLARAARFASDEMSERVATDPGLVWLRQRQALCTLGHLVAWSVHDGERVSGARSANQTWRPWQGWHANRTLQLMKVVAVHLRWSLDKVMSSAHNVAARASRLPDSCLSGAAPAESLIWPPPQLPAPLRLAEGDTPMPQPATTWPIDHAKLQDFSAQCRSGALGSARDLMQLALTTLRTALSLPRALVLLESAQEGGLRCRMAQGFTDQAVLSAVSVPVSGEEVLARLYRHSGALAVNPQRLKLIHAQLPASLQTLTVPSGMLLSTLKMGGRARGLVWADSGPRGAVPDEACYAAFCQFVADLGTGLGRIQAGA